MGGKGGMKEGRERGEGGEGEKEGEEGKGWRSGNRGVGRQCSVHITYPMLTILCLLRLPPVLGEYKRHYNTFPPLSISLISVPPPATPHPTLTPTPHTSCLW